MAARRNSESAPGSARAVRGEPHDEPATLPAPSPSKPSAQPRLQTALGLREDEPPRPSPSSTSFASAEFVVSQAGSSRTLRSASGTGGLDGALDFADESDLAAAFHEAEPHLMMPQRRRQSATDDSHKGHGKGLHVAFVPVEGDPHSTADSGSHDVPVVPMMTIRLPSEPGASTPTGGRAQPPTFFPNFPSSAPSPPRAVQFIGTSGGSSAILPSQQSRASNSSDRERQLEAEVESLRQQLASRDRALERREK